jgi:EmrB/QacA subfamily drug resistance transporter
VVDNTIVNVALPSLSGQLHASNSALQWIVDAYSLPFAGLLLAGGGLSDRLGRKRVMQVGLIFFAGFSAMSAWSGSASQLITARALMGLAAAFIFPATLSILTITFTDPRDRAKAYGIWGATSGLAVAFGPLTGGALIEHFWWGSVFLVNLPLVAITLIAGQIVIPESKSEFKRKFDFTGLILGSSGITILVLAIIQGPNWGWRSATTLSLFAGAVLLLAAFIVWERRRSEPLLDVRVFAKPAFSAGATSIAASFFCLFGFIFLLTQYFQLVRGYSALSAGVHTLPFAFTSMVVTPLGALLALRIGTRVVVGTGLVLVGISLVWIGTQPADAAFVGPILGSMIIQATGFSLITAPSTAAVMGSLSPEQIGAGSAVNNVTRELGGTLGVAVVGSAFSSVFGPQVVRAFGTVVPSAVANQASESMQSALGVVNSLPSGISQIVHPQIVHSFMNGFHRGCFVAAGAAFALSLLAFFLLPNKADQPPVAITAH